MISVYPLFTAPTVVWNFEFHWQSNRLQHDRHVSKILKLNFASSRSRLFFTTCFFSETDKHSQSEHRATNFNKPCESTGNNKRKVIYSISSKKKKRKNHYLNFEKLKRNHNNNKQISLQIFCDFVLIFFKVFYIWRRSTKTCNNFSFRLYICIYLFAIINKIFNSTAFKWR